MIQLSRYRGPATVAIGLVLAIALVDVGLTAAVGFTGRFLPDGESPTDDSVLRAAWEKVARILLPPGGAESGGHVPYGVLFGQSTLGAGVDAEVLEQSDDSPLLWYNLHGWGGSINRTRDIAELAFASGMRPDVVLLCINPYMLIGHNFEVEHRAIMRREGKFLKPWIWTYDNRQLVNHLSRMSWVRLRLWLLRTFDFGFLSLYPPPGPGKPTGRTKLPSSTAEQIAARAEEFRPLGWYDPSQYSIEGLNARSLVEIIRQARARGAKVAIVLMPEHSLFRRMIPPEAVRCFDEINRKDFPDDPVPIYNLRDRLADDLFFDTDHASVEGMRPVSAMVGDCVRDLLSRPARPPKDGAVRSSRS